MSCLRMSQIKKVGSFENFVILCDKTNFKHQNSRSKVMENSSIPQTIQSEIDKLLGLCTDFEHSKWTKENWQCVSCVKGLPTLVANRSLCVLRVKILCAFA